MGRLLVFGGDGLLGFHLYRTLAREHELTVTLHGPETRYPKRMFEAARTEFDVAAGDEAKVAEVFRSCRPDWVINGIGLVKRDLAGDRVASLEANTLFPHLLAKLSDRHEARLLHFSTDCVFSGSKGMYKESDPPDCQAWHGRCKALGEPTGGHVLVLRTSFIGLELACKRSLVEWFLAQRGEVPGYRKAIWSGLTALEVGRLVDVLVRREVPLGGLWHVAAPSISKFDLLTALNARLGARGVRVIPDDSFVCNRSLDGTAFLSHTGYIPPSWDSMLDELAEDICARWASETQAGPHALSRRY